MVNRPTTHRLLRLCVLLFTLAFLSPKDHLNAQTEQKDIGSWMVFVMNNSLSERWSIPVVGIVSCKNRLDRTEFGFLRTGISYKLKPKTSLTLGVAYVDNQPLDHHEFETLATQFWAYTQAGIKTGKYFKHRLRWENRWINKPTKELFNMRFRYRLGFKKSLNQNLYIICTDETFLNLDDFKINQNRFFLGLGTKLGPDIAMEAGYFKTHLNKNNFDRIRVVLSVKTKWFKRTTQDVSSTRIRESSK